MQSTSITLTPTSKVLVALILHNIIAQTPNETQLKLLLVMWWTL